MRDQYQDVSLKEKPVVGLAAIKSNWGACLDWTNYDSRVRCLEERSNGNFLFVRDKEHARFLKKSLEQYLPEVQKAMRQGTPTKQAESKYWWLTNLHCRLSSLLTQKKAKLVRLDTMETISDKFSHEIHREDYYTWIRGSMASCKGAGKPMHNNTVIRKRLKRKFKTPTPPSVNMVREIMEKIEAEEEEKREKAKRRKILQEAAQELDAKQQKQIEKVTKAKDREIESLQKQLEEATASLAASSATTQNAALESDPKKPEPSLSEKTSQWVLGLQSITGGILKVGADAVIRRTEEAIEVISKNRTHTILASADKQVLLQFDNGENTQPWPLMVGSSVELDDNGTPVCELI